MESLARPRRNFEHTSKIMKKQKHLLTVLLFCAWPGAGTTHAQSAGYFAVPTALSGVKDSYFPAVFEYPSIFGLSVSTFPVRRWRVPSAEFVIEE